ncbi:MAG: hypothetical protein NTV62_00875 [Candidatus Gribaldobacteria bacterium]|nr:hypothetical protein [Candidatus Gribaldobacteria bacterium]
MAKKLLGWTLLVVGLVAIVLGLLDSWQVFKGYKKAPEIFKTQATAGGVKINTDIPGVNTDLLQKQLQDSINQQMGGILPAGSIAEILNLLSWSIFIFILFSASAKIAGIGVNLLKENKPS